MSGCFLGARHDKLGGDPGTEPDLAGGSIHTVRRRWKVLLGKKRSGIFFLAC